MTGQQRLSSNRWPLDPFQFKRWSKWDPRRLAFVVWSRFQERWSRFRFDQFEMPQLPPGRIDDPLVFEQVDTAVTPEQAALLLDALRSTEGMPEPVVEVGSFRGVTSRLLATNTARTFIAVDPFAGYGGAADDLEVFQQRIAGLPNVVHLRQTSGQAARQLQSDCLSFVFIDALHDYVNTRFDSIAWVSLLGKGGIIAFHDTDDRQFAGTRRAVFELLSRSQFELKNHVQNLVILRKSS